MKTYCVGGAVRDLLLGLPVAERDYVVVDSTPAEMLKLGYKQVGKDFPVFLHPETNEEYALARTERKTAPGYAGFEFFAEGVSLEDDLKRRDLTINAMALDGDSIVDPYGGQQDLNARVLKHVSDAFAEDPLRVLRVARFAARFSAFGFTVHNKTLALMKSLKAELKYLTPERVLLETAKAINSPAPHVYFEILRQAGALEELFGKLDIAQVRKQLKYIPADTDLRFALTIGECQYPFNNRVKLYTKFLQVDKTSAAKTIERYKLLQDEQLNTMLKRALMAAKQSSLANNWDLIIKKIGSIDTSAIDVPPGPEYGAAKLALIEEVVAKYG